MPVKFDLSALSRRRSAKFALVSLMAIVAITFVTFTARAWRHKVSSTAKQDGFTQPLSARGRLHSRLALQPEADKQRRRLGRRFLAPGREVSILLGTIALGSDRYAVRIVRSRDDDDERLTIALNGGGQTLTWSGLNGALSSGAEAIGSLRALAERLALDSPDQFILAQLRGAAYFTVARDVRPAEVGGAGDYTGPRWDVVRITEPVSAGQNKPQSLWRLYYINTATGLIDKVISQERGQTITAEFSAWTNSSGEIMPAHTTWRLDNQAVMDLVSAIVRK
jgi:hypothetical protein